MTRPAIDRTNKPIREKMHCNAMRYLNDDNDDTMRWPKASKVERTLNDFFHFLYNVRICNTHACVSKSNCPFMETATKTITIASQKTTTPLHYCLLDVYSTQSLNSICSFFFFISFLKGFLRLLLVFFSYPSLFTFVCVTTISVRVEFILKWNEN